MNNNMFPEIENIKNLILSNFNQVKFNESDHIYTLNDKDITSVSNVVGKYYEHFNAEQKSIEMSNGDLKKSQILKDKWALKGKLACDQGHRVHSYAEDRFYNKQNDPSDGFEVAVLQFWNSLKPWQIPILAETRVYSEKYWYSGTFDLLLYDLKSKGLIIADYKGLSLDTPILTSKGWKTIDTIDKNDYIFDKDGNLTRVKNVSDIHYNPCYKLTIGTEEIIADHEHKWLIHFWRKNKQKEVVMTTEELYNWINTKNQKYSINIPKIYINKPLNLSEVNLPIDPYVLGLWLGDGNKIDAKITNANENIWNEINKRGYIVNNDVSQGNSGKAKMCTIHNISKKLRKLNLINNKHIPDIYLLSSYEQRLDLLRGFMDADGYYNKTRKRFVMATTQEWQKDEIIKLLSSLGIKATTIKCKKYCNDKIFNGWDICFTTNINPFLCRNQDIVLNTKLKVYNNFRNITSIEKVDTIPTKCLEVESNSHTFLFGYNMIVTHNTNENLFKNFKGKKMLEPFDFMLDTPYNHYQLQQSLYSIPIEDINIPVVDRWLIHLQPTGTFVKHELIDYSDHLRIDLLKNKH